MPDYTAIGDIHGMDATLAALLSRVPDTGTLVFLGDYLDRGPASREVVERLLQLEQERPCIFLRGNHEAMALAALDGDPTLERGWLLNGGLFTLESYGGRILPAHEAFLRRTQPYFETDDCIFVHAGLPPECRPDEVAPDVLWWIREPFLSTSYHWGKLVIHGHTPVEGGRPEFLPNRINIDTGAVYGFTLTALVLPEHTVVAEPARDLSPE